MNKFANYKHIGDYMRTIPLYPKTKRLLTPEEFLKLSTEERKKIKRVKIVPPKFGRWGFGKILVEYGTPIYDTSLRDVR